VLCLATPDTAATRYDRLRMLGELIGVGRTSEVYAVGSQHAAKVLNADVPAPCADAEAAFTTAVRFLGVRVPEVHEITTIDGRPAIIFERINGRSMWEEMLASPASFDELVEEFVEVQRSIHRAGVPVGLPSSSSRMCAKIRSVDSLSTADRTEACDMVLALPSGAALLHGDLHPGNVLMSADGPVVIDWFDATIGHPITDVVRTALLLRPAGAGALHHLPAADHGQLQTLHDRYVAAVCDMLAAEHDRIGDWESVAAVSRLAESTDPDPQDLTDRWAARRSTMPAWSLRRAIASASG